MYPLGFHRSPDFSQSGIKSCYYIAASESSSMPMRFFPKSYLIATVYSGGIYSDFFPVPDEVSFTPPHCDMSSLPSYNASTGFFLMYKLFSRSVISARVRSIPDHPYCID